MLMKSQELPSGRKSAVIITILSVTLIILFLLSFILGRYDVPVSDVAKILLGRIFPIEKNWDSNMEIAVINVRLPRIFLACLVGACLSLSGTAYQSVFQNPMASPDILGASSGACFGAALAMLLGLSKAGITTLAFVCSLITVALVFILGSSLRSSPVVDILLSGIVVGSLFSAGTSYIKLVADPSNQLPAITYWLIGSLSGARMKDVMFVLIPMTIGAVPLFALRWRINILTLGDDEADAIGINSGRLRLVTVICATLLVAAAVSVSGMIGWIGLTVPHLSRRLAGNNCKYLLPVSAIFGAVFLLLVDNISRNLLTVEIPIGILTAFIGAPFFIYLMIRSNRHETDH